MKKNTPLMIFKITCTVLYVFMVGLLIVEASMDGPTSGNQSTSISVVIADVINSIEIFEAPPITDVEAFSGVMRKVLGHFSTFLLLGVFSTFTYMLWFKDEKWKWSIPVNFAQGLAVAALTEGIQLLVPGRAGLLSDVGIDYGGFIISALTITIIMVVVYLNKKKRAGN